MAISKIQKYSDHNKVNSMRIPLLEADLANCPVVLFCHG